MIFQLDKDEITRLNEWYAEHKKTCRYGKPENQGAIGGALTFSFTQTSIGCVTEVRCACGAEEDLTDYKMW